MYNQEEYQSLILAALLHDIGKFYQRTGAKLGEEDKRLMTSCCPVYKGVYSHQHVLYSGIFFREVLDNKFQHIENIVLYHHCPESAGAKYRNLVKILTLLSKRGFGIGKDRQEKQIDILGNTRSLGLV